MVKELRPYQQATIDQILAHRAEGKDRILVVLPTGAGKTFTFSAIIQSYLEAFPNKKVVVLVHRQNLLSQARKELFNNYGIYSETVDRNVRFVNHFGVQVFVAMVDTAANRLRKRPNYFGDVGLVIIDEAHRGNFIKTHDFFPGALRLGFTATPISAKKTAPMKKQYQCIVATIDKPELIQMGSLVQNRTYSVKGINREKFALKAGKLDDDEMAKEFRKARHIENAIKAIKRYAPHKKSIVFNCNVDHSLRMNEALLQAGFDSRHIDGTTHPDAAKEIYQWFRDTPGAILNNIDVATTGYDEPSIECVVLNRSIGSLTLFEQACGRGSRPFPGKEFFTIIDMGGSAKALGDWSQHRDWVAIFNNPKGSSGGEGSGVAPVRDCIECEAMISIQARECPFCGTPQPIANDNEVTVDPFELEFEMITKMIDVQASVSHARRSGHSPYSVLHQIKGSIISQARAANPEMDYARAYKLLEAYQAKVKEWCRANEKNYDAWHRETSSKWFFDEIERVFSWTVEKLSIDLAL